MTSPAASLPENRLISENIPPELASLDQWVLYRMEKRVGKSTKVPYQPNGLKASTSDCATWSSLDQVLSVAPKFDGIGFVFNHNGIVGVDLDDCFRDGELTPEAHEIIDQMDSYTEVSPSGKGLHIFVKGKMPDGAPSRRGKIEVYETGRYFTFTGKALPNHTKIHERGEQLEQLIEKHLSKQKSPIQLVPDVIHEREEGPSLTDDDVIRLCRKATNRKKFSELFDDGIGEEGKSQSDWVLALLGILCFYTRDPQQLDRLFRQSALHSRHWIEKWDRRRDGDIAKALQLNTKQYRPRGKRGEPGATQSRITKQKDKATFEDVCQLIRDTFPNKPPKRDILSNDLYVWFEGEYQPAEGKIPYGILEAKMRFDDFYAHTTLESSIRTYASQLEPALLIDIPEWDGRDRIKEMADACNVTNINKSYFHEFIKAWGAKAMLRAFDYRNHQNTCIILKGGQGIGKDEWIDALVGGFGNYVAELRPTTDEVRKTSILSSALIIKLAEFERMNKIDSETLKHDITSKTDNQIEKYGKVVKQFKFRASWIASANTLDFFRDPTGNRRFWVFEISGPPKEAIEWGYPNTATDKLQVLAQFQQLASEGYQISEAAKTAMDTYIATMTPEDENELILHDFDSQVLSRIESFTISPDEYPLPDGRIGYRVTNDQLRDWGIFDNLRKEHGMAPKTLQKLLKVRGRAWRTNRGRGYCAIKQ